MPTATVVRLARYELIAVDTRADQPVAAELCETGRAWAERDGGPEAANRVLVLRSAGRDAVSSNLGKTRSPG